jgi:prepilin-type N-terminal cleavage/methylation domain-containing protein
MNRNRQGFTLVELAIVLVIIGLLVGGILVGQDLIKAATVRTTVSDIEKINYYRSQVVEIVNSSPTYENLSDRLINFVS